MCNTHKLIEITPEELDTVKQILRKHLPAGILIWVFGSRAINTAKEFSDLDIALQKEDGQRLNSSIIIKIMDEFEESYLPYKVDVIDYNTASGIFKQNVDSQKVLLN